MSTTHLKSASTIGMAFAAMGIVFGDIGTSPLYAFHASIHSPGLPIGETAILGVASLIFWTLTLIVSIKYLLFITLVDNNGEGGIFAIASVLRRHISASNRPAQAAILALVIASAALLFADSLITPPLSIMAAVEGVEIIYPEARGFVVVASLVVVVILFVAQRFGTQALSRLFSPVMLCWFVAIGLLGLAQIASRPEVLWAVSPTYAIELAGQLTWPQLFGLFGSILLAATGAEAIYIDMGHFGRRAISHAWYTVAMLGLLLNYFGQSAWLLGTPGSTANAFFAMAPTELLIPLVVLATLASFIAGQAVISGMFSIATQAIRQGYLPRLRVLHTSDLMRGQVYVPLINTLLLIGSVLLIVVFQASEPLAASYGFAVSATMLLTTIAFSAVILVVWRWSVWKALVFVFLAVPFDLLFLSATITKLPSGHYFTLVVTIVASWFMLSWLIGESLLRRRVQRIDMPVSDFADVIGLRTDLHLQKRPAVFFQHLPFPADVRVTPFALLQQVNVTSLMYQPAVIVEFLPSDLPRVGEAERIEVHEYSQNIILVHATFGYREPLTVAPIVRLGQERGWWKQEEDLVYYSARENLRHVGRDALPFPVRWSFALLHKLDQELMGALDLEPTRCVELGLVIRV
jgi:KUP system potassium uptake protein